MHSGIIKLATSKLPPSPPSWCHLLDRFIKLVTSKLPPRLLSRCHALDYLVSHELGHATGMLACTPAPKLPPPRHKQVGGWP